jgi:hypothetical protein
MAKLFFIAILAILCLVNAIMSPWANPPQVPQVDCQRTKGASMSSGSQDSFSISLENTFSLASGIDLVSVLGVQKIRGVLSFFCHIHCSMLFSFVSGSYIYYATFPDSTYGQRGQYDAAPSRPVILCTNISSSDPWVGRYLACVMYYDMVLYFIHFSP